MMDDAGVNVCSKHIQFPYPWQDEPCIHIYFDDEKSKRVNELIKSARDCLFNVTIA